MDTSPAVASLVADHHRALTADDRCRAASSMFDSARAIVESSLAADLTSGQRRLAIARRFYGNELPEAAYAAHGAFAPGSTDR